MQLIDSLTIDIHRLGALSAQGVIQSDQSYIALSGSDAPPVSRRIGLEHEEFLRNLHALRYPEQVTEPRADDALLVLGKKAAELLSGLIPKGEGPAVQIDLVLGAAELWAFPFEACVIDGTTVFADGIRPLVLTRRIRQGFAAWRRPWPVRPKILFVHAPETQDLDGSLIRQHIEALEAALMPWSSNGNPQADGLLQVEVALGTRDIEKALRMAREAESPFTHIHVLAHGKGIRDPITDQVRWGLRLGDARKIASDPEELADALHPEDGAPVVVTVAACDAANQAATAVPRKSFAQELHKLGIPVVVASQLPLTMPGSVTMTRAFYGPLLRGEDVRLALHQSRLELRGDVEAGHDWLSVVAYLQLPEGYADHLMEVGVKREMALLRAARKQLDAMEETLDATNEEAEANLDEIQEKITERISSLEGRLKAIPNERTNLRSECHGVLSSAHKRLAELLFRRGNRAGRTPEARTRLQQLSREILNASLDNYRNAFHSDIRNHWLGVQQLALEAALEGKLRDERDWATALYAAELALAQDQSEYWAYGTIAELWMLVTILRRPQNLLRAKEALDKLRVGAERAGDTDAVPATRDQLGRYVTWWTKEHGFFGDRIDLAEDAKELLQHLDDK